MSVNVLLSDFSSRSEQESWTGEKRMCSVLVARARRVELLYSI